MNRTETPTTWQPAPRDVHTIRHGYNLADIQHLTRAAVAAARTHTTDYTDRHDAAWHAIVELLFTSTQAPDPWTLKQAGIGAVNRQAKSHAHTWGYDLHSRDGGQMRGFARYWDLIVRATPSPETQVADRVAFWQIWPLLADSHRDVLLAMAACGTRQDAARSLGLSQVQFDNRLMRARRAFWVPWHEHETPPRRVWGRNDPRSGRRTETRLLADRARTRRTA